LLEIRKLTHQLIKLTITDSGSITPVVAEAMLCQLLNQITVAVLDLGWNGRV
jgi:hypothetical protein